MRFHAILDVFSVAYQQTNDEKDLEYAFFGIFDGHGGREAAQFAKVGTKGFKGYPQSAYNLMGYFNWKLLF